VERPLCRSPDRGEPPKKWIVRHQKQQIHVDHKNRSTAPAVQLSPYRHFPCLDVTTGSLRKHITDGAASISYRSYRFYQPSDGEGTRQFEPGFFTVLDGQGSKFRPYGWVHGWVRQYSQGVPDSICLIAECAFPDMIEANESCHSVGVIRESWKKRYGEMDLV
jgi:hypothetical protein